jgi:hypothetical protein
MWDEVAVRRGAFVVFGRVMNAEVYRNIAYLSADSPAVEIERWDGAGLRFSENVCLATGNSQPFSMTESPGVGLESTGDVFRRNATALNPSTGKLGDDLQPWIARALL